MDREIVTSLDADATEREDWILGEGIRIDVLGGLTGWVGQLTKWIEGYAVRGLEIGAGAALVILGITIVGKGIVASTPAQATAGAVRTLK